MFHSTEIRWFFEGRPDASIVSWFAQSGLAREEDPRIDAYLVLPGCTSAGVKVREGHLEIKALTSAPETVHYDNGIAGKRASWVKWSSGIAGAPLLAERKGPESWVQVEKSRSLRLYSTSAGDATEVSADSRLDGDGCQFELAALRVIADGQDWQDAASWWSVCFEAFGNQTQHILDGVASRPQFAEIAASLPLDASMPYPDWLSVIGAYT